MGREVKRVPAGFDWPLKTAWAGYLNPYSSACRECADCGGTGYAPRAREMSAQWHGNAPFDPAAYGAVPLTADHPGIRAIAERNVTHAPEFYCRLGQSRDAAIASEVARLFDHFRGQWSHQLVQADVDALVAAGRLHDLTHRWTRGEGWVPIEPPPAVTAERVNAWSFAGFGHDAINQGVCVRARCEREGEPVTCAACDGHGHVWPSKAHEALADAWERVEPPAGEAWQMWETTSEGSPISPAFATAEELARWLADTGASTFGSETASYESWLGMILEGWAPSFVVQGGVATSGVEAVGQ